MALIQLQQVELSFGSAALLDHVDFSINQGDKIGLVGRNGAGKSTLLKLLSADLVPDDGQMVVQTGVRISRLRQEIPQNLTGTAQQMVEAAASKADEAADPWQITQRASQIITRLGLPPESEFSDLSGGLKRRCLLGCALAEQPDLLLLDEPTNHLDIDSIAWLEGFLSAYRGALVVVTHDRQFLQRVVNRIVEVDRGRLMDYPGDYQRYLTTRAQHLAAEEKANAEFDKKLAQEEVWIRQGIKARRTRNEGRVRRLETMRKERSERREQVGRVKVQAVAGAKSGKKVIEVNDLSFGYPGKPIVKNFSTVIARGDKIGIIGKNGEGKTTLVNLLLGKLQPDSGEVILGTQLDIVYFDQQKALLDESRSAQDNVSGGRDMMRVAGKERHVISYLQDFLFTPERARAPITALSGGERSRLVLAKIFAEQANLMVLDEPTNDLDIETLELLEDLLLDYPGTLILISHDRAFLNNVVTSTMVLEGEGSIGEYVGGYDDWQRQKSFLESNNEPATSATTKGSAGDKSKPTKKRLSYKFQRELDAVPAEIERLESAIEAQTGLMADPAFYQQEPKEIASGKQRLEALEAELETVFERWQELEAMQEDA